MSINFYKCNVDVIIFSLIIKWPKNLATIPPPHVFYNSGSFRKEMEAMRLWERTNKEIKRENSGKIFLKNLKFGISYTNRIVCSTAEKEGRENVTIGIDITETLKVKHWTETLKHIFTPTNARVLDTHDVTTREKLDTYRTPPNLSTNLHHFLTRSCKSWYRIPQTQTSLM